MTMRRLDVNRLLHWYVRWIGGGDWPFLRAERKYLGSRIEPGAAVADIGGGDGKLANALAPKVRRVFVLDRELLAKGLCSDLGGSPADRAEFHRGDMVASRAQLGIPQDARVLLFVANGVKQNVFKDYETLRKAVEQVARQRSAGQAEYAATDTNEHASLRTKLIPAAAYAKAAAIRD